MEEKVPQERILAFDYLRVVAILGVILIHTTTKTLELGGYVIGSMPITLFVNQMMRFSLPLFFLLSGFLLEYRYRSLNFKTFFKKRIEKILVPYILWSIFYFLYFEAKTHFSLQDFLYDVLIGGARYHLYFIVTMIIFYVLFPILHKYLFIFQRKRFFILFTILEITLLIMEYYSKEIHSITAIRIAILGLYFFVTGMLVSHKKDELLCSIKKFRWGIIIMFFATAVIAYLESKVFYLKFYNIHYIYDPWRPSIFLLSLCASGWLFYFFSRVKKWHGFVHQIANVSFFIYFVHPFFIDFFRDTIGKNLLQFPLFDLLLFSFVVICSFSLAYLLKFLPKFRWTLGLQ